MDRYVDNNASANGSISGSNFSSLEDNAANFDYDGQRIDIYLKHRIGAPQRVSENVNERINYYYKSNGYRSLTNSAYSSAMTFSRSQQSDYVTGLTLSTPWSTDDGNFSKQYPKDSLVLNGVTYYPDSTVVAAPSINLNGSSLSIASNGGHLTSSTGGITDTYNVVYMHDDPVSPGPQQSNQFTHNEHQPVNHERPASRTPVSSNVDNVNLINYKRKVSKRDVIHRRGRLNGYNQNGKTRFRYRGNQLAARYLIKQRIQHHLSTVGQKRQWYSDIASGYISNFRKRGHEKRILYNYVTRLFRYDNSREAVQQDSHNYVNGINDARLGQVISSHDLAYLAGYQSFQKLDADRLPQTNDGSHVKKLTLAAAIMIVLSLFMNIPAVMRKHSCR